MAKGIKEVDQKKIDKLTADAARFSLQGNFTQALVCYKQIDSLQPTELIRQKMRECQEQQLRKFWRQGRADEFKRTAQQLGAQEALELVLARIQGHQALSSLAQTLQGPAAKQAYCALQADVDVKAALLALRQLPDLKELAEGWMALLKGDIERAKASFSIAKDKAPVQADIGHGVALLAQGDLSAAASSLARLRPFAARCFPAIAAAMGWGDRDEEARRKLSSCLFTATLEELRLTERTMLPTQTALRGWIWLRIGDYLWQNKATKDQACNAWRKAEGFNRDLFIDAARRLFLASLNGDSDENPNNLFRDLYGAIAKKSLTEASDFLEYLVYHSDVRAVLSHRTIRRLSTWQLSPALPALQFLWFKMIYEDRIRDLVPLFFLPKISVERLLLLEWKEFEELFSVLDPCYGEQELYLCYKFEVARLFQKRTIMRQTLFTRLRGNPFLKEELLANYVKVALPMVRSPDSSELKDEVAQEVALLRELFSNDYDLIRLAILTRKSSELFHEQVVAFAPYLSEPLYGALRFQLAIDQGWGLARCRPLLPSAALRGVDKEADWRMFSALCTTRMNFPKAELKKILVVLAPDSDTKHRFFSTLARYDEVVPPHSLIEEWQKQAARDWRPQYHLALYCLGKGEYEKCLDIFEEIYQSIPGQAPEDFRVHKMLELHRGRFSRQFRCLSQFTDEEFDRWKKDFDNAR